MKTIQLKPGQSFDSNGTLVLEIEGTEYAIQKAVPKYVKQDSLGNAIVTLTDGTKVTLRKPKAKDSRSVQQYLSTIGEPTETDVVLATITAICTKWGEKEGTTVEELEETDLVDYRRLTLAVDSFPSD